MDRNEILAIISELEEQHDVAVVSGDIETVQSSLIAIDYYESML